VRAFKPVGLFFTSGFGENHYLPFLKKKLDSYWASTTWPLVLAYENFALAMWMAHDASTAQWWPRATQAEAIFISAIDQS